MENVNDVDLEITDQEEQEIDECLFSRKTVHNVNLLIENIRKHKSKFD